MEDSVKALSPMKIDTTTTWQEQVRTNPAKHLQRQYQTVSAAPGLIITGAELVSGQSTALGTRLMAGFVTRRGK